MVGKFPGRDSFRKLLWTGIAICGLPLFAIAGQQTPRSDDAACRQYTKPTIRMAAGDAGQTVKLDDLIDKQSQFYGKIVTVEGEMHRIFSERVFTIEDDDLLKDDDVLIISDVPRQQAVVALENSVEPGKNVRVTGYVHKFDQKELECLYGPLQTESREGHSFTKSPVLIVQRVQAAEAQPQAQPQQQRAQTEVSQVPAAQPERQATPAQAPANTGLAEQPSDLPRTAGELPFIGLLGLVFVVSAFAIRLFHA
jgi:hypothetical protein